MSKLDLKNVSVISKDGVKHSTDDVYRSKELLQFVNRFTIMNLLLQDSRHLIDLINNENSTVVIDQKNDTVYLQNASTKLNDEFHSFFRNPNSF
ncbi:hypothetical protein [uncultured Roseivirga sp.]|mgnify:CR=1 FL=1|uniref:hypothetical protein n=1 Tax=uncultured Roseivirga sp. TaxID=543088 RepID=UPI0030D7DBE3|tara:strand:- start:6722 stop:7003 length:282 start_codon:yes stop_codon:yes gene_type:complete